MRRQILPAIGMLIVFSILTGLVYPFVTTGLAQAAFKDKANGSLVRVDGEVVGSRWIGQSFTEAKYFHPRPSADDYVPGAPGGGTNSYGSNYGPTDPRLRAAVRKYAKVYRAENGLADETEVPVDAVTTSGSGLDPHISVANARIQARRVASERSLSLKTVLRLVDEHTDGRGLRFLGEPGVNVLELNLALDAV